MKKRYHETHQTEDDFKYANHCKGSFVFLICGINFTQFPLPHGFLFLSSRMCTFFSTRPFSLNGLGWSRPWTAELWPSPGSLYLPLRHRFDLVLRGVSQSHNPPASEYSFNVYGCSAYVPVYVRGPMETRVQEWPSCCMGAVSWTRASFAKRSRCS